MSVFWKSALNENRFLANSEFLKVGYKLSQDLICAVYIDLENLRVQTRQEDNTFAVFERFNFFTLIRINTRVKMALWHIPLLQSRDPVEEAMDEMLDMFTFPPMRYRNVYPRWHGLQPFYERRGKQKRLAI